MPISKYETAQISPFSSWWLVLLFFCASAMYSQSKNSIEGKLTDDLKEIVINASVLLKDSSGNIVTYAISDENGNFVLKTTSIGVHTIEVSHIAYSLYSTTIKLTKSINTYPYNIILKPKSNTINEVVIQGRKKVVQQRGDTLSYSLGAFTTGNEQKLKDIIKKLPGLEIDENGKIKSGGKIVDKLLVDGKPFFGDNHKIATDNLNAKMIGGIDLLKNYEAFDALKEIEGSNEIALNIKIKEQYKGKPTGSIEAYGAYKKRYRLHTNLFSFAKTHNLSFIGDLNNTGQQPISLLDYIQMDKSKEIKNKEDEISSIGSGSNLPSFLLNNDNRTKQQSKFGALNAVFTPINNMAIEAFSILDIENIKSKQFSNHQYFSKNQTIYSDELINEENKFLISQTNINAEYKTTKNSLLNYTLDFKPKKNDYYTNINGKIESQKQTTTQKINNSGYVLGQNLGYVTRLTKNKLLSINAFSNYTHDITQLNLLSNQPLFDIGNTITQQIANENEEYGLYSRYTQRSKNHIMKFNVGYILEKSVFYNTSLSNKDTSLNKQNYLYTGASIERKKGLFQYKALVNMRNYNLLANDKKDNFWVFLPALENKLQFSKTHYVSLKYKRQVGLPNAYYLNPFSYVIDYRNFRLNSNVDYNNTIINNHFGFQYYYFNLYSGMQILFNSSYNKTENNIGVNSQITGNHNYSNYLKTPYKSNWVNTLRFQTRISPIKTIFKLELDVTNTVFNNYVNTIKNMATNQQKSIKSSLASYFKEFWINYEIGMSIKQNNTKFELIKIESKGTITSSFINLNGVFAKNWSYFINNNLSYYKTKNTQRNIHRLDVELKYKKEPSKFSYWISGNNIFNLISPQITEVYTKNNSTSQNIIYQMPGYIGIGTSYSF